MGMAASQARLLTLTARIHDIEYQAQAIQNAKLQLATQSDAAYTDYLNELDATTLTINSVNPLTGSQGLVAASFNNLCGVNRLLSVKGMNYALQDRYGRLIVSDDIYEAYMDFMSGDVKGGKDATAYQFAVYMLGDINAQLAPEDLIGPLNNTTGQNEGPEALAYQQVLASEDISDEDKERLQNLYNKILEILSTENAPATNIYDKTTAVDNGKLKEYEESMNAYQKLLYELWGEQICEAASDTRYDKNKFNYYVEIFNQIQAAGGCVPISDYNGPDGDAANDTEWLKAMVEAGLISVHLVNVDEDTDYVTFDGTSPSSDIALQYVQTTDVDKTALKKAEAKYEKALKDIDQKDKRFDMDLSKLETERTALTTELDQVKSVAKENIERTFKIFS